MQFCAVFCKYPPSAAPKFYTCAYFVSSDPSDILLTPWTHHAEIQLVERFSRIPFRLRSGISWERQGDDIHVDGIGYTPGKLEIWFPVGDAIPIGPFVLDAYLETSEPDSDGEFTLDFKFFETHKLHLEFSFDRPATGKLWQ